MRKRASVQSRGEEKVTIRFENLNVSLASLLNFLDSLEDLASSLAATTTNSLQRYSSTPTGQVSGIVDKHGRIRLVRFTNIELSEGSILITFGVQTSTRLPRRMLLALVAATIAMAMSAPPLKGGDADLVEKYLLQKSQVSRQLEAAQVALVRVLDDGRILAKELSTKVSIVPGTIEVNFGIKLEPLQQVADHMMEALLLLLAVRPRRPRKPPTELEQAREFELISETKGTILEEDQQKQIHAWKEIAQAQASVINQFRALQTNGITQENEPNDPEQQLRELEDKLGMNVKKISHTVATAATEQENPQATPREDR